MRPKQRTTSVGALWIALAGLSAAVAIPAMSAGSAYAQSDIDKQNALQAYKKGTIQYNLGKWDEAIGFFELAFETYPDPAFLFNIAQAYRQAENCQKATFFYGRYLALKPDATNIDEVEGFITELKTKCQAVPKRAEPVPASNASEPVTEDPGAPTTLESRPTAETHTHAEARSEILQLHASAGSSILFAGPELDTPPQLSITFGAGYPIELGSLVLDAGVLTTYSPIEWKTANGSGTTSFIGALANVGASRALVSRISVRGEIGAGLMFVTGLGDAQNVFTEDGMSVDELALSASFRVALGAELALSDMLAVTVQPAIFTISPAPSAMRSSIDSVSTYQALIGLGLDL